jgi:hypothetical protein
MMGCACNGHGKDEKCVQNLRWKTGREGNTLVILTLI